jgi:hypothetical protein
LVTDQDNAGASGNVPVIGDIQQKLFEHLALNPAVKDRDQRLKVCDLKAPRL